MMNKTVMDLRVGDVLGSGFVVSHNPYSLIRTPKGKVEVEGNYPGSGLKRYTWNMRTIVQVVS